MEELLFEIFRIVRIFGNFGIFVFPVSEWHFITMSRLKSKNLETESFWISWAGVARGSFRLESTLVKRTHEQTES
jgi:hypothetical protein